VTFVIAALLVAIAMTGSAVVLTHDPFRQTAMLGIYGLLLAVLFVTFQAPDVALSIVAVGVVLLPLMILIALAKIEGRSR